jgi:hypothetical protein
VNAVLGTKLIDYDGDVETIPHPKNLAAVGISHLDAAPGRQSKPPDDGFRQDQSRRAGIDDTLDGFTAHLIHRQ